MSIFKNQLTFKALTPERILSLKMELAIYAWTLPAVFLAIVFLIRKKEINAFVRLLFEPISEPIKSFFQSVILPPLLEFSKHFHYPTEILHSIGEWLRHFGQFLGALLWPTVTLGFLALAIAYHSGMIGPGRKRTVNNQTVLGHEFHKWKIRLFEARIDLLLTPKSWWRTMFSIGILFVITYVMMFAFFSGFLPMLIPIYFPLSEPGMNNWFIASLHDAHIKTPQSWSDYSTAYSAVNNQHMELIRSNIFGFAIPFSGLPEMPPDLQRLRIFFAALCSAIGAFPFTLSTIALGIDSVGDRRLTLTPTRLLCVRRSLYFLFSTKTYRWTDLVRASFAESKGSDSRGPSERNRVELNPDESSEWNGAPDKTQCAKVLNLEFSNGRTLKVPMKQLSAKDQHTLMQALDELAPVCEFSTELKQLMSEARTESASCGYTVFWDDELSKKRRSTVFSPLEQGATLQDGRLEILRQLSGQGWSATYLARSNGEFVVVRESLLSDETEAGKRAWATLEKEAKILSALDHQGIAKVIDHFVESGRSYLLLEYVVGTDLRKKTSLCGKLSNKTVIEIAERICDILIYLHSQELPVIHRDISPDNLVITPNGEVKLIDFAASKQCIETATGTMIGKRSYMAPEQLRGKATVRSDVYSLGATLHYLLTGQDPVALTQCRPAEIRSDVDVRLNELIQEMTDFDEHLRPDSIFQVKQRLASLREGYGLLDKMFEGLSSESITIKLKHYEAEKI